MTPQEQEMIGDLIDRVQKTQLAEKDVDAEQMLRQGLGLNPDALYILAQTVLVQKYALEQAQAQLSDAKAQIEQMQQHPEPKHATSFLGSLLGRNDAPAPPPPPPAPAQSYPPQGQPYPPYTAVNAPQYGAPQYAPPSGGGGFLQGAMQTAAGVAAGALAFEGVESLMHGFGHAAGYGQEFGGFGGGGQQRPEEIVNNYYGDDRGGRDSDGRGSDDRGSDDRGGHDTSAAEREEGGREDRDFAGNDERATADDSSNFVDTGNDDSSNFDDASYDDSGDFGGDDSGGDDSSFS